MAERKPFLLRLDPETFAALQAWAADDLRSVNGQVEFLLRRALRDAGRMPGRGGAAAIRSHEPAPITAGAPTTSTISRARRLLESRHADREVGVERPFGAMPRASCPNPAGGRLSVPIASAGLGERGPSAPVSAACPVSARCGRRPIVGGERRVVHDGMAVLYAQPFGGRAALPAATRLDPGAARRPRRGSRRSMIACDRGASANASLDTLDRLARRSRRRADRRPAAADRDRARGPGRRGPCALRGGGSALLERRGYVCAPKCEIVDGRLRGWIDLLAFDPVIRRLLVVEVKTELRDVGGLQRQVGWYQRAGPSGCAGALGWTVRRRSSWSSSWRRTRTTLPLSRTATRSRRRSRFVGVRSAICSSSVRAGPSPWGLVMIDPRRRGDRVWAATRLDGRRTPAPYRSTTPTSWRRPAVVEGARVAGAGGHRLARAGRAGSAAPV